MSHARDAVRGVFEASIQRFRSELAELDQQQRTERSLQLGRRVHVARACLGTAAILRDEVDAMLALFDEQAEGG